MTYSILHPQGIALLQNFFSKQYKIVDNSIKIQSEIVYITYRQTPLARDSAVFGYHR